VERDAANLCLVVRRSELRRTGGWTELLASVLDGNRHVQYCLQGAKALWDRPLALSSIPYGYLAGRPFGLWCVGDQAAVIPSFTGDGMSIALQSAVLATEMYLAGESAGQYYRRLHAQLRRGMSLATLLSRIMVTRAGRNLAPFGLSLFPGAMRWIAASTRVPEQARLAHPRRAGEDGGTESRSGGVAASTRGRAGTGSCAAVQTGGFPPWQADRAAASATGFHFEE